MIKLLFPLPKNIVVALSGGVDSVAAIDFLSRKHDVTAAFFHHNTENSERAYQFVSQYCHKTRIPLMVGFLDGTKPNGLSMEEWWRNCRYDFLDSIGDSLGPVITAHHLQDSVETYIHSALNGTPKVIPYMRNNVWRPFLTTKKSEFQQWAKKNKLEWCEDSSNSDLKYMRNYIRNVMMPHALHVNPGLPKIVSKIIQKQVG